MFKFFKNPSTWLGAGKKLLVTHDGGFHADDVFACAVLELYLDKKGERYEVVRTRDPKIIERADYVFDVGGVYDASKNRFDHHQKDRAGTRENGILYAAAGLVWRKFGKNFVHDEGVEILDKKIFQALDSADNGQDLVKSLYGDVFPYSAPAIIGLFNLSWKESGNSVDEEFSKMLKFTKELLKREFEQLKTAEESAKDIKERYENSLDKRLIILDKPYSRMEIFRVLVNFSEPLYFIYPKSNGDAWKVEALRISRESFDLRKSFPESWRGLRDEDFQRVSGVPDAIFAHDGRFYCVAKTFEGALALAKLALNS